MKQILEAALFWIMSGKIPTVVMSNSKTNYSILDNVPQLNCFGSCPVRRKCYDVALLRRYPNAIIARARRHYLMQLKPHLYAEQAKKEIARLVRLRGLTHMRIYTGGDFHPNQMPILLSILSAFPSIRFYMISKMIRGYIEHAKELLEKKNFFLNLSEMAEFRFGSEWDKLRAHPQVNSVYTLMPEEADFTLARASDIVFNVKKTKVKIALYKEEGLSLCPCDAKDIPHKGACSACRRCVTKIGGK